MVDAVRGGLSLRAVAWQFRVSLPTVRRWGARAQGQPLDHVEWRARPPVPHRVRRTAPAVEDQGLALRRERRATSDLGEAGAPAIHREWLARGWALPLAQSVSPRREQMLCVSDVRWTPVHGDPRPPAPSARRREEGI